MLQKMISLAIFKQYFKELNYQYFNISKMLDAGDVTVDDS